MSNELKYFIIGFCFCAIICFFLFNYQFNINEYSEEAIITIRTHEDINNFNFELENYISGRNNKLDIKKIIEDYEEYYKN